MKKTYLAIIFSVFIISDLSAQKKSGYTFKVEKLTKPDKLLGVSSYDDILKFCIDYKRRLTQQGGHTLIDTTHNIVAKSMIRDSLVNYNYHSFYMGMYHAYAEHRPFTLSPDMIWLLIAQGFSNHVNNNSELLRPLFVDFDGKLDLIVTENTAKISLDDPNAPWEKLFDDFSKQIAKHTGNELTAAMTADFSTTTPITKMASQLTLMDAMKTFFSFNYVIRGCGIPNITLQGTPQDWERVLTKAKALRKYKLDWWIDELEPVLTQFIQASKKKPDPEFWKAMFALHQGKICGPPDRVDGWIVKFFPYDKQGNRNDLKELIGDGNLPDEMVNVPLKYQVINANGAVTDTPLELWAGFVGLEQNRKTFGLTPRIGWMIRKKDAFDLTLVETLKKEQAMRGLNLRVSAIPAELFLIGPIEHLKIEFIKDIVIPDEMAKVPIKFLDLKGHTTEAEADRIVAMFPNTKVTINKSDFESR